MANMTLRALSVEQGWDGAATIRSLAKTSGLIRVAEAIPASHNIKHKHKRFDALPTFTWGDRGGSQGDTTVNSNNYETALKLVSANQSESADILKSWPGGPEAYFEQQRPAYEEAFGQSASVGLVYGNDSTHGNAGGPVGLHQYAKNASKQIVNSQAGDSGSTTSIFAIKFKSGPNGCGILYNPQAANAGIMKTEVLNGGNVTLETTNTSGRLKTRVYQVAHTGELAFLTCGSKDIAVYHKIQDAASERPTAAKMDELIDAVEFDDNTVLFMNRATRRMLNLLNDSKLQTDPITTDYYSFLSSWNGVPIMIEDNILSTEANTLW